MKNLKRVLSLMMAVLLCFGLFPGSAFAAENDYDGYVDTVGRNKKVIADYIRNQLEEDYAADQISIKEFTDPFTGDKRK